MLSSLVCLTLPHDTKFSNTTETAWFIKVQSFKDMERCPRSQCYRSLSWGQRWREEHTLANLLGRSTSFHLNSVQVQRSVLSSLTSHAGARAAVFASHAPSAGVSGASRTVESHAALSQSALQPSAIWSFLPIQARDWPPSPSPANSDKRPCVCFNTQNLRE